MSRLLAVIVAVSFLGLCSAFDFKAFRSAGGNAIAWDARQIVSSSEFPCTSEGFYVHPANCSRFYRCVDFTSENIIFSRYLFECPENNVFAQTIEACVPGVCPDSLTAIEGGSESATETQGQQEASTGDSSTGSDGSMGGETPSGSDGSSGGETPVGSDGTMGGETPAGSDGSSGGETPSGSDGTMGGETPAGSDGSMAGETPSGSDGSSGGETPSGSDGSSGGETPSGSDGSMGGETPSGSDGSMGGETPAGSDGSMGEDAASQGKPCPADNNYFKQSDEYCNVFYKCGKESELYTCNQGTAFNEEKQMCRLTSFEEELCINKQVFELSSANFRNGFAWEDVGVFPIEVPVVPNSLPFTFSNIADIKEDSPVYSNTQLSDPKQPNPINLSDLNEPFGIVPNNEFLANDLSIFDSTGLNDVSTGGTGILLADDNNNVYEVLDKVTPEELLSGDIYAAFSADNLGTVAATNDPALTSALYEQHLMDELLRDSYAFPSESSLYDASLGYGDIYDPYSYYTGNEARYSTDNDLQMAYLEALLSRYGSQSYSPSASGYGYSQTNPQQSQRYNTYGGAQSGISPFFNKYMTNSGSYNPYSSSYPVSQYSSQYFSPQRNTGYFSNPLRSSMFSNNQVSGGYLGSQYPSVMTQQPSSAYSNYVLSSLLSNHPQTSQLFSAPQTSGLFSTPQSSGLFPTPQSSGLFSMPQASSPFSIPQNSGFYSTPQTSGSYSSSPFMSAFQSYLNPMSSELGSVGSQTALDTINKETNKLNEMALNKLMEEYYDIKKQAATNKKTEDPETKKKLSTLERTINDQLMSSLYDSSVSPFTSAFGIPSLDYIGSGLSPRDNGLGSDVIEVVPITQHELDYIVKAQDFTLGEGPLTEKDIASLKSGDAILASVPYGYKK